MNLAEAIRIAHHPTEQISLTLGFGPLQPQMPGEAIRVPASCELCGAELTMCPITLEAIAKDPIRHLACVGCYTVVNNSAPPPIFAKVPN